MRMVGILGYLCIGLVTLVSFQNCGKLDEIKAGKLDTPSQTLEDETGEPSETALPVTEEVAEGTANILPPATVIGAGVLRGNGLLLPGVEVATTTSYILPVSEEGLMLTVRGYDADSSDEIEILADGVRVGFIPEGLNDELTIPIQVQLPIGAEVVTFQQVRNPAFRWGINVESAQWMSQVELSTQPLQDVSSTPAQTTCLLTYTILDDQGMPVPLPGAVQYRVAGESQWLNRSAIEDSYNFSTQNQDLASGATELPLVPDTDYEWRVLVGLERRPSEVGSFRTLP